MRKLGFENYSYVLAIDEKVRQIAPRKFNYNSLLL